MSLKSTTRRIGAVAVAACALAVTAAPAHAASASNPLGCAPTQDLSTPLTAFGDQNLYALAPGGTFEAGTTDGWTLQSASFVPDQASAQVLGAGAQSLRLGDRGVAISAPMCIDETFPNFRFFARNLGQDGSKLKVEVLFLDEKGKPATAKSGDLAVKGKDWTLVSPMRIGIDIHRDALNGAAPIVFRFTAGKGGDWRIDDLLVDPYRRG
jgi:hypothetical protein